MSTIDGYKLTDRYTRDEGTVFMTGIQALARLPIEQLRVDRSAGLVTAAFAAGYPGSPLGGLDSALAQAARQAPDLPIELRPSVNEEYAATAVMGSQLAASRPDAKYDGVVGLWYGKAPGVDRASDALRHGVFAGSDPHGGAVALVGDDPAAKSSTLPSSSAGVLADMHIPVLYPGDPAEALDLGRHAIALSRASGLWVGLKIVADVADGSGTVILDPHRISPEVPLVDGAPYVHIPDGMIVTPHTLDIEQEILEIRAPLALEYAALNQLNYVTVDPADAWVGIVSSGITYREVREALRQLGLETEAEIKAAGIRLLKLGMPIPFNASTVRSFSTGLEEIIVVEEKNPGVESLVKDALYNASHHPMVVGRTDEHDNPMLPGRGSLHADDIAPALRARLTPRIGAQLRPAKEVRERIALSVSRTPYFCSGCPHNRSTVVEEGTLVGAGIGCHTMIILGDEERYGDVAGLTCMGNEGTQWIGLAPFVETDHLVQNLGDGTFFHSGQLAITAAIAADSHITYKLLWNGAVAMTGGQDPTGGIGLDGVCNQLLAQGVKRVIITSEEPKRATKLRLPPEVDVWPRTRLEEAQRTLAAIDGVTVLIHDQRCAAELRRERRREPADAASMRVVINHRVCEGCGDCAAVSNCLSVQPIDTPFGRKTTIDQHSCNLDLSCLEGDCPAFISISHKPPRWWRRGKGAATTLALPSGHGLASIPSPLPDPDPRHSDDVSVHITGIGGTGVVTVSQMIGTAAMLEGADVQGLDQIGLSQKAGPVVSDVRITHGAPAGSNRVGAGQADLLLAFDLLVASSWTGLEATDPTRTSVVGSLELIPPGAKTAHPEIDMPSVDDLLERIAGSTRPEARHWAQATDISNALVGDSVGANIFVVGMAVQAGLLPVSPDAIEQAIELNGVGIELNTAAFRWGRWWVADRNVVEAAMSDGQAEAEVAKLPTSLEAMANSITPEAPELTAKVKMLTAELVAFQNQALATQFLDDLDRVARAERAADHDSTQLTEEVAVGLHKLLAYKDEYEVARLMLDPDGHAEVGRVAQKGDRATWRLHPPTLRSLGRSSKISLSMRWRPIFRLLSMGKRVRGTWLDPFGRAEVRRVERALPREYLDAVGEALHALEAIPGTAEDEIAEAIDLATEVARTADLVRGYEHVKMRNVERFRARLVELAPAGAV